MGIISFLSIWMLSPVESENKPLDEMEQRVYKKVSRVTVMVQSGTLVVLFSLNLKEYFYAGYSSMILVAVFVILGKIMKKTPINIK